MHSCGRGSLRTSCCKIFCRELEDLEVLRQEVTKPRAEVEFNKTPLKVTTALKILVFPRCLKTRVFPRCFENKRLTRCLENKSFTSLPWKQEFFLIAMKSFQTIYSYVHSNIHLPCSFTAMVLLVANAHERLPSLLFSFVLQHSFLMLISNYICFCPLTVAKC